MIEPGRTPLLTDLYQLTMLQVYYERGMEETAVFEFFVRRLPEDRNFLVAAGLEQLLEFLEGLRFAADDLEWIRASGYFNPGFADHLARFRFTGDVDAMPEGTVFFGDEPIVRVTAPLPEAQLIESRLINLIQFQTLIASKAVRVVLAAPDKLLVDFGLRRSHGAEAGLLAARACYLAGFSGTATVLAGREFGIPLYGTMAHSFVQAHPSEALAFDRFAESHPANVTLLIDTYDTEAAAEQIVRMAPDLTRRGLTIQAVRLDSGDLAAHAKAVRRTFDQAGLGAIRIFASGSLDEHELQELLARGAPIDGFGLGTRINTSADAPYLDCVYKLQEYAGQARRKRSEGKATWPGRKQVYRSRGADGTIAGDVLTVEGDRQAGTALIAPAMRTGRRVGPAESLDAIRARVRSELGRLPAGLLALDRTAAYPVDVSPALEALAADVDRRTEVG